MPCPWEICPSRGFCDLALVDLVALRPLEGPWRHKIHERGVARGWGALRWGVERACAAFCRGGGEVGKGREGRIGTWGRVGAVADPYHRIVFDLENATPGTGVFRAVWHRESVVSTGDSALTSLGLDIDP